MSVIVQAYGTGDPDTREFRILERTGVSIYKVRSTFTLRLSDIPDLISELSEWVDES